MLRALLDDLVRIDGIRLTVLRDARLDLPRLKAPDRSPEFVRVRSDDEFEAVWRDAILNVDAVWPIAPETGGILEKLCADVQESGKILFGCPADAVAKTTRKLETLRRLEQVGIEVVSTVRLTDFDDQFSGPWVVKPNDGVGCEGTRMVRNLSQLLRLKVLPQAHNLIVQPFVDGDAMSLSLLLNRGEALLLSCNRQNIEIREDRFFLTGCTVNVPVEREVFSNLGRAVARTIPALFGYAGVDFVFAKGRPRVLEVNPRLTTSFAGLSRALNRNVAAMVIDLLRPASRLPGRIENPGVRIDITLDERHGF